MSVKIFERKLNEDLARFESVGDAQVSPDGALVVYTLSSHDKKDDKGLSSLYLVPTDGGKPRRLTQSGKDRNPRWSKDGNTVAFVSDRSGIPQIWVIRVDGGEARRIPTERAVGSIAWSPDGRSIAFTAKDFTKDDTWTPYPGAPEGDRRRAVELAKKALDGPKSPQGNVSKPGDVDSGGEAKGSDVKVITRFDYKADGSGLRGDLRDHVFVVETGDDGEESSQRPPARMLTGGDFDHTSPSWSPDGKYVLMTALRREDADYLMKQDLWLVEVKSGRLVHLFRGAGPIHNPQFSPGGTRIAFVGHDGSSGPTTQTGLWVLDVDEFLRMELGGESAVQEPLVQDQARLLTGSLDRPIGYASSSDIHFGMGNPFRWETDEGLLFSVGDRGAGSLYRVRSTSRDVWGDPVRIWGDDTCNLVSFDCGGGRYVFQMGSHDKTEELYSFDESSSALTKLTESNPWLTEFALAKTERITFRGPDDWEIDGFLTYPVDYEQGKSYPTVLFIHGGPAGAYGPNFMYQSQIMAARGFATLGVNPRGSSTYSQEFLHAVVEDWGGKDYQDIMSGVDEVIARGVADAENLFVTGWSYGGYMTSWVVTQTDRFKAAVGGAIISDRYSMHSTEDIVLFGEHYFGAAPWDDADKLLSRSPLAQVKNVTTPVMILHGELDIRCPTTQGEEFYSALKRLGKTAVFVRYPGEYHGFRKMSHRVDRFERTLAWFIHYLKR